MLRMHNISDQGRPQTSGFERTFDMAQATTNIQLATPGILQRIGAFFVRLSENNHRIRRVEQLNAMTDAQLEKLGIRREDIVRHVFADVMYI